MIILLVSDVHSFKWAEFDTIDPTIGYSSRLDDCLEVWRKVRKIAEKHHVDQIIALGDIFHKMGIIEVETYNRTFQEVQKTAQISDVLLLHGNHDHADRLGTQHSLMPFSAIKNVTVVQESGLFTIKPFRGPSLDVMMIPYIDNKEQAMATAKKARGDLLCFTHLGFEGAFVGSAIEYLVKEPLSPAEFGKLFRFVFSGHYHRLQYVHDNVMYVGSPLEHTRSDVTDDEKGVLILDTDKPDSPTFVPLGLPRFLRVEELETSTQKVTNNFIDYQLAFKEEAEEVKRELLRRGARGIRILPYVSEEERQARSDKTKRIKINTSMSMVDIVRKAVKKRHGQLDKDQLEAIMLDILNQAEARR